MRTVFVEFINENKNITLIRRNIRNIQTFILKKNKWELAGGKKEKNGCKVFFVGFNNFFFFFLL